MLTTKITPIESRRVEYLTVQPSQLREHPELQDVLPRASAADHMNLETSIVRNGVRDRLIVFRDAAVDPDHVCIANGVERWHIAVKHDLKLTVEIRHFENLDEVRLYRIDDRLARGHLTQQERQTLIDRRDEIEQTLARERQREGGKRSWLVRASQIQRSPNGKFSSGTTPPQSEQKSLLTLVPRHKSAARVAEQSGESQSTIEHRRYIRRHNPELYEKVKNSELPIDAAYRLAKKLNIPTDVEHACCRRLIRLESNHISALFKTWQKMDDALKEMSAEAVEKVRSLADLPREIRLLIHHARGHLKLLESLLPRNKPNKRLKASSR